MVCPSGSARQGVPPNTAHGPRVVTGARLHGGAPADPARGRHRATAGRPPATDPPGRPAVHRSRRPGVRRSTRYARPE
ncbi:MAG: hypothetical protein E6G35_12775 [Actinobacteria bacterium]|nr:MAG: hypothetical protein E6G35_12775 [Actinomycetota bacterium]